MPFTPFHMGPALVVKALAQRRFSLMVFGWSQIIMDLQPLYVLLTGHGHLHGFTHTLIGAALLGVCAAVSGKYAGTWGLRLLREARHLPITWPVAFLSAFIGTFSHVIIDSIMHVDLQPFYPFSEDSPLYRLIGIDSLHWWCLGAALAGSALYYILERRR